MTDFNNDIARLAKPIMLDFEVEQMVTALKQENAELRQALSQILIAECHCFESSTSEECGYVSHMTARRLIGKREDHFADPGNQK